jgi:hypothetical protein
LTNSYFNYSTITEGDYSFGNIFPTRKNKNISNTFLLNNDYLFYYKDIVNDTRLELLSYTEYNDAKYWDLLFYINNMDNIFDLPNSNDIIVNKAINKLIAFETKFGALSTNTLISDDLYISFYGSKFDRISSVNNKSIRDYYYDGYLQEFELSNETHRHFRFVKSKYISQLLGYINGL